MLALLNAPENFPFAVALAVMLLLVIIEAVGILSGVGMFSFLSTDADMPEPEAGDTLGSILAWLRVREVPVIILLILFLTGFGISGLIIQQAVQALFGVMLPALIASIPAFILSLPVVRGLGGLLNRIMPKDETTAVSKESFIGRTAVITLGEAQRGKAAQAKLRDTHGQDHYIMVEPDEENTVFRQGTSILLVRRSGGTFYAIANDHALMGGDA